MDTSWIKPGAEIVVYSTGRTAHYYVTTVKTVAAKSFTVDRAQIPERFSLETLESKRLGGTWDSWRYVAVQVGSDKHKQLERIERVRRAVSVAHGAVEEWLRKRTDPALARAASAALMDAAVHIEMGDLS